MSCHHLSRPALRHLLSKLVLLSCFILFMAVMAWYQRCHRRLARIPAQVAIMSPGHQVISQYRCRYLASRKFVESAELPHRPSTTNLIKEPEHGCRVPNQHSPCCLSSRDGTSTVLPLTASGNVDTSKVLYCIWDSQRNIDGTLFPGRCLISTLIPTFKCRIQMFILQRQSINCNFIWKLWN